MNIYSDVKNELFQTLSLLDKLFKKAADIPGTEDRLFNDWKVSCDLIRRQLSEEMIRVAVIGSIKSGKSTLVNAFIKGDYLKRGAGVITSFVTRIRRGESLQANLFFKNWNVFALPKYPQGCGVTQYLASYIRGTPVKDKNILYYDDQILVLSCRDKRIHDGIEKKGKITLTINQFLQRLLLHFPPYQLRLVRYYGIYHPKNCNILKRLQLLFNKQPDINFESSNYSFDKLTPEELRCPNCGTIRNFLKDLKPDELLAYENILSGKDPPKAA